MSESKELAVISGDAAMQAYMPRTMNDAFQLAKHFAGSRALGSLDTPEKVFLVMATGAELRIPPTAALRTISVIEGKAALGADLIVALCLREEKLCEYFYCTESTADRAVYVTKRRNNPTQQTMTFTMEEARQAGLVRDKSNWVKWPKAMLRHRASAELARMVYPELTLGIYAMEELNVVGDAEVADLGPGPAQRQTMPVATATPAPAATQATTPPPPAATKDEAIDAEYTEKGAATPAADAAKADASAAIEDLIGRMAKSQSIDEVKKLGQEFVASKAACTPEQIERGKKVYKDRFEELKLLGDAPKKPEREPGEEG